jgi:hypothetical protein
MSCPGGATAPQVQTTLHFLSSLLVRANGLHNTVSSTARDVIFRRYFGASAEAPIAAMGALVESMMHADAAASGGGTGGGGGRCGYRLAMELTAPLLLDVLPRSRERLAQLLLGNPTLLPVLCSEERMPQLLRCLEDSGLLPEANNNNDDDHDHDHDHDHDIRHRRQLQPSAANPEPAAGCLERLRRSISARRTEGTLRGLSLARVQAAYATLCAALGHARAGLVPLTEAVAQLKERLGDTHSEVAMCLGALSEIEFGIGDDLMSLAEEGAPPSSSRAPGPHIAPFVGTVPSSWHDLGWSHASECVSTCRVRRERPGIPALHARVLACQARHLMRRGKPTEASRCVERALEAVPQTESTHGLLVELARCQHACGEPEAAMSSLRAAHERCLSQMTMVPAARRRREARQIARAFEGLHAETRRQRIEAAAAKTRGVEGRLNNNGGDGDRDGGKNPRRGGGDVHDDVHDDDRDGRFGLGGDDYDDEYGDDDYGGHPVGRRHDDGTTGRGAQQRRDRNHRRSQRHGDSGRGRDGTHRGVRDGTATLRPLVRTPRRAPPSRGVSWSQRPVRGYVPIHKRADQTSKPPQPEDAALDFPFRPTTSASARRRPGEKIIFERGLPVPRASPEPDFPFHPEISSRSKRLAAKRAEREATATASAQQGGAAPSAAAAAGSGSGDDSTRGHRRVQAVESGTDLPFAPSLSRRTQAIATATPLDKLAAPKRVRESPPRPPLPASQRRQTVNNKQQPGGGRENTVGNPSREAPTAEDQTSHHPKTETAAPATESTTTTTTAPFDASSEPLGDHRADDGDHHGDRGDDDHGDRGDVQGDGRIVEPARLPSAFVRKPEAN